MTPPSRTPVWLWPNLLCLDAPLVAILWQDFLARCYPSTLLPSGRWALGLTVWAIYLADRLLDVRHPVAWPEPARHQFYRIHRRLGSALLVIAVTADVCIVCFWLRPAVLSNGLWVGAAVGSYLMLFAFLKTAHLLSKQVCAAVLFTAGVFLVSWTSTPGALLQLSAPAMLFGSLALENLALIQNWEQGGTRMRAPLWMLGLCCAVAVWGGSHWYWAIALSAAGLTLLNLSAARVAPEARHVLADVVLLTPLFL